MGGRGETKVKEEGNGSGSLAEWIGETRRDAFTDSMISKKEEGG